MLKSSSFQILVKILLKLIRRYLIFSSQRKSLILNFFFFCSAQQGFPELIFDILRAKAIFKIQHFNFAQTLTGIVEKQHALISFHFFFKFHIV